MQSHNLIHSYESSYPYNKHRLRIATHQKTKRPQPTLKTRHHESGILILTSDHCPTSRSRVYSVTSSPTVW
jgi:hypothetical protein